MLNLSIISEPVKKVEITTSPGTKPARKLQDQRKTLRSNFNLKFNFNFTGRVPNVSHPCRYHCRPMINVSNSQGRNLGRSVTSARTSGLCSIQGDLGKSGKSIFNSQSNY